MELYKYYQQIGPYVYKRKNRNEQHVILAVILFTLGFYFFIKKAPQVEAYIAAVIFFIFGCSFILKLFSSVVIDLAGQKVIQKSGIFSSRKTIPFADIQGFSISNRIYVLLLISTAYAFINEAGKEKSVLLVQNLMNPKNTEAFLLETERLIGRR